MGDPFENTVLSIIEVVGYSYSSVPVHVVAIFVLKSQQGKRTLSRRHAVCPGKINDMY